MYRLGLNKTLSVVSRSLKHGGYKVVVDKGNIYVCVLDKESVVHHRNDTITYKDCYLVKDEYIEYNDVLGDYQLFDCGGKEYKITTNFMGTFVYNLKKYKGVK